MAWFWSWRVRAGSSFMSSMASSARTLGYQPALAQALLTQQIVRVSQKSAPDAPLPPHHEATQLALQIGDDPLAVETYARELYVRSREGLREHPDTMALIEALARRLGPEGRFPRALLHNNLGAAALAAGDRKTAQPYFRRALEEARLDTTENIELAYIPMNLALAVDAPGEAEQLFTEGITRIIRLLGPQHPLALSAQTSFVLLTANAELARSRAQTTCDRYLTWHPHLGQEVVECAYTLGWLADERGDSADAARWMKVASGPQADEATIAKAYLRFAGGDATLPVELDALAAELRASQTWWRRTWASDAGLLAALTWRRAGQPRRALAALEAALPVIEETNRIQSNAFHQRRLARVRAELAMELMKLEPARARQLQNQAIAWYTQAGGYDRLIARLSASL